MFPEFRLDPCSDVSRQDTKLVFPEVDSLVGSIMGSNNEIPGRTNRESECGHELIMIIILCYIQEVCFYTKLN